MKKTIAIVLGSLTLGLGVVGIAVAAYDTESSDEAKADFCESLTDLSSTVMSYEGIDLRTATNDELDAAAGDIEESWDEVVDDAEDWAYADDNELYDAYSDLYWAIDGLDGDNTRADNVEDLEDELSAFPEAFRATFDGSGCTTA
jgi:hypothetical protein